MPDEIFQPYASATTSVAFIEKGIPHDPTRETVFVQIKYDGFTLKKGTRVPSADSEDQIPIALDAVLNKRIAPGFSGLPSINGRDEWRPGTYIPSALSTVDEIQISISEFVRRRASFYAWCSVEITSLRTSIATCNVPLAKFAISVSSTSC